MAVAESASQADTICSNDTARRAGLSAIAELLVSRAVRQ